MKTPPTALTIAGSDNSAGAGAQADLKTFTALGVYGLTAITCVVAEVPGKVSAIAPVPPEIVAEQVRLCFEAYPVAALKTGMLYSRPVVEAVCATLETAFAGMASRPALVVDPVMIATSGDPLLEPDAIAVYRERLFALATLITPNLDETAVLLDEKVTTLQEMRAAGHQLCRRYGTAFLLKGGHLPDEQGAVADLLVMPDGSMAEFTAPRVPGVFTHGTGCTFSAAVTAGLANGLPLAQAVACGKEFVSQAIASYFRWKRPGDRSEQCDAGETHALNHRLPRSSPPA